MRSAPWSYTGYAFLISSSYMPRPFVSPCIIFFFSSYSSSSRFRPSKPVIASLLIRPPSLGTPNIYSSPRSPLYCTLTQPIVLHPFHVGSLLPSMILNILHCVSYTGLPSDCTHAVLGLRNFICYASSIFLSFSAYAFQSQTAEHTLTYFYQRFFWLIRLIPYILLSKGTA
jgi:hypothetical protein